MDRPDEQREDRSGKEALARRVLVCPQCKAQYIPLKQTLGRRVRCRHCGHVWRDLYAAADQVAAALGPAAAHWAQLGSTMIAATDHGSTMGRMAGKLSRPAQLVAAEWIGKSLGRYEIRAVLGQGAMGHVYEAYDRDLERTVALKVLPRQIEPTRQPLGLRMFLQEARVAAQIQHPNVVTVYEIGQQDGIYFFAMERVEGVTLSTLIEKGGPLPASRACYVIAHAAMGLAAGHALGIVHRDVKPGNIMINASGQVKVTDFGLADVSGLGGIRELSERTLGTPGWISPEVARGEKPTPASDIYSLGLTLFYTLTGQRLVNAETKSGMLRQQQTAGNVRREQLPRNLPPRLADITLQCLQADPRDRYESASVLSADLLRALSPDSRDATMVLEKAKGVVGRTVSPVLGWAALGALFLLVAAFAAWYWFFR